ncbi:MAG: ferritin-like domain-containing protein [Rhodothermales bacterium]|nr:ferritin-like domain-containing protein [Rhodothermales bacterium]
MTLDTFEALYVQQLKDLYSVETQIIEALPKMADEADHAELKQAFQDHLQQTKAQKDRLDQLAKKLGEDLSGHTCQGMKGILKEAQEMIKMRADEAVRDAGLIADAQRVEHYEIAGYGMVCTFAERLGREEDLRLLRQTLQEEKATDEKLTALAKRLVNPDAARAS